MNDMRSKTRKLSKAGKTTSPVRHITVSEEARKAYEDLVNRRDERQRTYERHLATDKR